MSAFSKNTFFTQTRFQLTMEFCRCFPTQKIQFSNTSIHALCFFSQHAKPKRLSPQLNINSPPNSFSAKNGRQCSKTKPPTILCFKNVWLATQNLRAHCTDQQKPSLPLSAPCQKLSKTDSFDYFCCQRHKFVVTL